MRKSGYLLIELCCTIIVVLLFIKAISIVQNNITVSVKNQKNDLIELSTISSIFEGQTVKENIQAIRQEKTPTYLTMTRRKNFFPIFDSTKKKVSIKLKNVYYENESKNTKKSWSIFGPLARS